MRRRFLSRLGLALLAVLVYYGAVTAGSSTRQKAVSSSTATAQPPEVALPLNSVDACRSALALPSRSPPVPHTGPLRVMSWNTMKYSRPGSRALLDRLGDRVDVLLLQEALRGEVPRDGDPQQRYFADGFLTWSDEQTGVELRSRYAADAVCKLSFTEPWLRSPKAVLATRLPFPGQALLVINLHAINFTITARAYREQLDAISDLLAVHDGPAIVAGDFNNWNAGRQLALENFAQGNGLSIASFEPDLRSRHLGVPVDGLLQRGLDLIDAAALPTTVSDHHPLILLLEQPRARQHRQPHAPDDGPAARR